MSEVQRDPPKPKKNTPAYNITHAEAMTIRRLIEINAKTIKTAKANNSIVIAVAILRHPSFIVACTVVSYSSNPRSRMLDGPSLLSDNPPASAPNIFNESTIVPAIFIPVVAFVSSHQKNPVKIVNLTNSAKNSPMSALRKAIMPNVQTMEITTSVQNSQDAASVMVPAQPLLAFKNLSETSFRTPPRSIAAAAF